MAKSKQRAEKFTKYRKDGTKMRSGSFDQEGNQVGEWTTYDRAGAVAKVTDMNRKRKPG